MCVGDELSARERDDSDHVPTSVIYMWCCFIFKLVFDSICNSETDNGLLQSLMWNVELAPADITYNKLHMITLCNSSGG